MWRVLQVAILSVVAVLALASVAWSAPSHRVALVIGNAHYSTWRSLQNPINDATMIAKRLREIGFDEKDVKLATDLTLAETLAELSAFTEKARGADLAVIYYTGHGGKIGDESWIIPTGAPVPASLDSATVGVNALRVQQLINIAGKAHVGLVLIDACREKVGTSGDGSGEATKGGLASLMGITVATSQLPEGVIVQTSTKADQPAYDGLGDHSLYAIAVDEEFQNKDLEIRDVLERVRKAVFAADPRQEPWVFSQNMENTWISLGLTPPPANVTFMRRPDQDAAAEDATNWKFARRMNSREAYRAYLADHAKGAHRNEADVALAFIDTGAPAAPPPVHFDGTIDEARRALATITPREWRSDDPRILAMKAAATTTATGVRRLSDSGDDRATVILAGMLDEGPGGATKDSPAATLLYQKASLKGNPQALRVMGDFTRTGRDGKSGRTSDAAPFYEQAAKAGDATAQDRLGALYASGELGEKERKKAVALFQAAADQQDPWGQCHIGAAYAEGVLGLKADQKKALTYTQASADQGNACGEMQLGHMYLTGVPGLARDTARGAELYRDAAKQGDPIAITSLGLLYQMGEVVARDLNHAAQLYEQAAALNYPQAEYLLGVLYSGAEPTSPKDLVKAVAYFKAAAARGLPAAEAAVGWAYANGLGGLPHDDGEALRLFNLAANAGDAEGQYRLGYANAEGQGLSKNAAEARRLMKAAAAQGYDPAARWLNGQGGS